MENQNFNMLFVHPKIQNDIKNSMHGLGTRDSIRNVIKAKIGNENNCNHSLHAISLEEGCSELTNQTIWPSDFKSIELLRYVTSDNTEADNQFYLRSRYYYLSCDLDIDNKKLDTETFMELNKLYNAEEVIESITFPVENDSSGGFFIDDSIDCTLYLNKDDKYEFELLSHETNDSSNLKQDKVFKNHYNHSFEIGNRCLTNAESKEIFNDGDNADSMICFLTSQSYYDQSHFEGIFADVSFVRNRVLDCEHSRISDNEVISDEKIDISKQSTDTNETSGVCVANEKEDILTKDGHSNKCNIDGLNLHSLDLNKKDNDIRGSLIQKSKSDMGSAFNNLTETTEEYYNKYEHNERVDVIVSIGSSVISPCRCLTAVIQTLFSCKKFRDEIVAYHKSDDIVTACVDGDVQKVNEELIFVNDFCRLFSDMADKINPIAAKEFLKFPESCSFRDCYEEILSTIKEVMKTEILGPTNEALSDDQRSNYGHISDLFYGQIKSKTWCANCLFILEDKYTTIQSIQLERGVGGGFIDIQKCIDYYFSDREQLTNDDKTTNCCDCSRIISSNVLTHAPDYILFHIVVNDRLGYSHTENSDVSCDGYLVPVKDGCILYSVQARISDIYGQYFTQCLYDQWYLIPDTGKPSITEVVTNTNTVALLMKRQH